MTREQLIWKEAAEVIASHHSAVDAIAECLERAKSAAPVAAEPPSLVALVERLRQACAGGWGWHDGSVKRAVDDLFDWTPAQAEPAAPVWKQVAEDLRRGSVWVRTPGNVERQDAIDECARMLSNLAAQYEARAAALPASSPAAPEAQPEKP